MFRNSASFLLAIVFSINAFAGDLCPNPKAGFAAPAFGMTSFWGESCKTQLARAKWLGFTSVSMSPTFFFHPDTGNVEGQVPVAGFVDCLNAAKDLGFDIVYKPMIEALPGTQAKAPNSSPYFTDSPKTLEQALMQTPNQTNAPWRAYFDFHPQASNYLKEALNPFLDWLESGKLVGTSFRTSIVIATEMHRSIVDHALEWNNLIWGLHARLDQNGLRSQVQIGMDQTVFGNDSWLVDYLKRPLTADDCTQYQNTIWSADFFSPSVYGDYIKEGFNSNPAKSVGGLIGTIESEWERDLKSRGCTPAPGLVTRFHQKIWAGEIGYGGALNRTWSGFDTLPPYGQGQAALDHYAQTTLVTEQHNFIVQAPVWVKGVLDFSRSSNQGTVSFWITGRFDLFGFSDLPPLGELNSYQGEYTSKDPVKGPDAIPAIANIRDTLQAYTAARCNP